VLLGIPVTTVIGGILTQEAFAHGSLPTALTTMTVTDPVLSYAAALTLFAAAARPHPIPLAGAAVLVLGGVALLANSPTLHDERDHDVHTGPDSNARNRLGDDVDDGHDGDIRGESDGADAGNRCDDDSGGECVNDAGETIDQVR
jgi:hypothetical protein